ncbi:DUF6397 family protein [Streptomyces sp. LaPpAH-108]|uniref:DUF6397 family protein n=1 Tax=Streptomyces sp. LaPpAH-108 TaxID=1155714 RepID=UPI00037A70C7|nr:DUF6397 family protein [Streptomyces sp. LaPpAH-108]
MPGTTLTSPSPTTCTPSRAARELGLNRAEFDLAVQLGRVRTMRDEGGGGRRVERTEIDRIRAEDGFPETLRARVRLVTTTGAAALMDISPGRFARLARLGLLVPVRFYLNRYRVVVWQYLAEEVEEFAARDVNAHLLEGRTPETLRSQVAAGVDLRARNWRGRHLGFLLRDAEGDPWARAGALASLLPPDEVAAATETPAERARLDRLRPVPPRHGAPGTPSADLAEELMTAQDPDEIMWLCADLEQALREARAADSPKEARARSPRPSPASMPRRPGSLVRPQTPEAARERRRLLAWLRGRRSRNALAPTGTRRSDGTRTCLRGT